MTKLSRFMVVAALTLTALAASAQTPAGAPAGANGQCNDGSYSMDAKKQGACRGHKGIKTWFVAAAAPAPAAAPSRSAAPAPAASALPAASPAPSNANPAAKPASSPSSPAAANTPAKPSAARQGPGAAAASRTAAAGGGPGMVWVNTDSKVYHCPGTTFYGKTKQGQYMSESAAKAAGAHADRNKACGL